MKYLENCVSVEEVYKSRDEELQEHMLRYFLYSGT